MKSDVMYKISTIFVNKKYSCSPVTLELNLGLMILKITFF